jgi:hypothetical protein
LARSWASFVTVTRWPARTTSPTVAWILPFTIKPVRLLGFPVKVTFPPPSKTAVSALRVLSVTDLPVMLPFTTKSAFGETKDTLPFEVTLPLMKFTPLPPRTFTRLFPPRKSKTSSLPVVRLKPESHWKTLSEVIVKIVRVPVGVAT